MYVKRWRERKKKQTRSISMRMSGGDGDGGGGSPVNLPTCHQCWFIISARVKLIESWWYTRKVVKRVSLKQVDVHITQKNTQAKVNIDWYSILHGAINSSVVEGKEREREGGRKRKKAADMSAVVRNLHTQLSWKKVKYLIVYKKRGSIFFSRQVSVDTSCYIIFFSLSLLTITAVSEFNLNLPHFLSLVILFFFSSLSFSLLFHLTIVSRERLQSHSCLISSENQAVVS